MFTYSITGFINQLQGHKWSLSAFLKHLKANNIDTVQLMQSIEDVIIKAIISVEFPVNSACKMFVPHRLDAMLALFSYSFSGTTVLSSTGLIFWLTLT